LVNSSVSFLGDHGVGGCPLRMFDLAGGLYCSGCVWLRLIVNLPGRLARFGGVMVGLTVGRFRTSQGRRWWAEFVRLDRHEGAGQRR
jgi:hypothetical protein